LPAADSVDVHHGIQTTVPPARCLPVTINDILVNENEDRNENYCRTRIE